MVSKFIFFTVFLVVILLGCDAINPFAPETTTIEKIAGDAAHGDDNKYIDETVKLDATVWIIYKSDTDGCYEMGLDTHTARVF